MSNPQLDGLNKVAVPTGWAASQRLVDTLKRHITQGGQVGPQDMNELLDAIIGSQLEVIHAFGSQQVKPGE